MSTFDSYSDTPFRVASEGEEISIKFVRTGDTTGKISWNIPESNSGCNSGIDSVYNGMLITLDTTPTAISKQPKDGTKYTADNTADTSKHLGDKIGTALVVGFLCDDKTTLSIDITDLEPKTAYYVSGHMLDQIFTYHSSGVHSYSVALGSQKQDDTAATQQIIVGAPDIGVLPTDPTGFISGQSYTLEMFLDNDIKHTFTFDGINILTYQDLIDNWNLQAKLIGNPLQSPTIPNLGMYYFNSTNNTLSQWNGSTHTSLTVVIEDTQPNIATFGDLWYDTTNNILNEWSGTAWVPQTIITFSNEPNALECDDLWFDTLNITTSIWDGTVWVPVQLHNQITDPSLAPTLDCSAHWFDTTNSILYEYDEKCKKWEITLALLWDVDPTALTIGDKWFNETINELYNWNGTAFVMIAVTISETQPTTVPPGGFWYKLSTMELFVESLGTFTEIDVLLWPKDPTQPAAGDLWWNGTTNQLFTRDALTNTWVQTLPFFMQATDPSLAPTLVIGCIWYNGTIFKKWDGSEWITTQVIENNINPANVVIGQYWFDTTTSTYKEWDGTNWITKIVTFLATDPYTPTLGDFWYQSSTSLLFSFDGTNYNSIPFSTVPLTPINGFTYFDTTLNELRTWNGTGYQNATPQFIVSLTANNQCLLITSSLLGSFSRVDVFSNPIQEFFLSMTPNATPKDARRGGDGLSDVPSYAEIGVGDDGSTDERHELIDSIRHQLGYPTVDVELTKQQMNYAIDSAIEALRKRSSVSYKRGFYFFDIEPGQQHYSLTDKRNGFNKIVDVLDIHRMTSSFLSVAGGDALYGQLALQSLYQMGSFDLISYHMVSQYIETMERMFASDITYNWNEDNRTLSIYKDLIRKERVLMEVLVERTEQAMIKDRLLKGWIEKYAMAQCRIMLSEIRGKYASLPGAGGGVSLNAIDLAARADADLIELYEQIENFIADDPSEWGVSSTFILG
jgi:hypothetical protein